MASITGVYAICNAANGRAYVGASVDVKTRWMLHRSCLRGGRHANPALQSDWVRYGEDSFRIDLLEEHGLDGLSDAEQAWMDRLGADCDLYNRHPAISRKRPPRRRAQASRVTPVSPALPAAPSRAMDDLMTAYQVADVLGIHHTRVRRLAVAHSIGRKLSPRTWVFSPADVETMRACSNGPGKRGYPEGRPRPRKATGAEPEPDAG